MRDESQSPVASQMKRCSASCTTTLMGSVGREGVARDLGDEGEAGGAAEDGLRPGNKGAPRVSHAPVGRWRQSRALDCRMASS